MKYVLTAKDLVDLERMVRGLAKVKSKMEVEGDEEATLRRNIGIDTLSAKASRWCEGDAKRRWLVENQ